MIRSRRTVSRRSPRSSAWMSTLILEAMALLVIIGLARPMWVQDAVHQFSRTIVPAVNPIVEHSFVPSIEDGLHPMDAFQPPVLTPVPMPAHVHPEAYSIFPYATQFERN